MSRSQKDVLRELEEQGYTVTRRGWPSFLAVKDGKVRLIKVISPKATARLFPEQVQVFHALARLGIIVEVARGSLLDCADYRESLPPSIFASQPQTKTGETTPFLLGDLGEPTEG